MVHCFVYLGSGICIA